jgi:preprotein translocase subunit SecF
MVTWILSFRSSPRSAEEIGDQLVASLEATGIQASLTGTWDIAPRIPMQRLLAWAGYALLALLSIFLICLLPWSGISVVGARAVPALAVVAIALHDVLFAAGLAALLRFEIDLPTIVGLLVVLGYSVNDSLVLLWHLSDKRRPEVTATMGPEAVDEVIMGIRNRTMNTTLTTLAAVVPVILFASRSFQGYALVVVTGISIGTISSIFLLGQVMKLFIGWQADQGTEPGVQVPVQI